MNLTHPTTAAVLAHAAEQARATGSVRYVVQQGGVYWITREPPEALRLGLDTGCVVVVQPDGGRVVMQRAEARTA